VRANRAAPLLLALVALAPPGWPQPAGEASVAAELREKLGQLLIVNVDGFATGEGVAISPAYLDLVEAIQPGGVLPHYGTRSFSRVRQANEELRKRARLPLLVAADLLVLGGEDRGSGARAEFGDGYEGGLSLRRASLDAGDFKLLSQANAYVYRAAGIDCALGPVVDNSSGGASAARALVELGAYRGLGVASTLKHWPFLPPGYSLHLRSRDAEVPESEALGLASPFSLLAPSADLVMTTHVYDSLVDPQNIVTFSAAWLCLLKSKIGPGPLIVSDGLLMLRNYAGGATPLTRVPGWPAGSEDDPGPWAALAILAGHDMVILEGKASSTRRAFESILALSLREGEPGPALRRRILESWERIVAFKLGRAKPANPEIEASPALVERIASAVARLDSSPLSFRELLGAEAAAAIEGSAGAIALPMESRMPGGY
jgi:beta-glucosidase-like glycosyl hydrolase